MIDKGMRGLWYHTSTGDWALSQQIGEWWATNTTTRKEVHAIEVDQLLDVLDTVEKIETMPPRAEASGERTTGGGMNVIDCARGRCERLQDALAELRITLEALHTAAMERDQVDSGWLAHELRMALAHIGGSTHESPRES